LAQIRRTIAASTQDPPRIAQGDQGDRQIERQSLDCQDVAACVISERLSS
jgi:hypothetical protein